MKELCFCIKFSQKTISALFPPPSGKVVINYLNPFIHNFEKWPKIL